MLTAHVSLVNFDDDSDWLTPPSKANYYRAASVGNSWGVTSIGRGFDWSTELIDKDANSVAMEAEAKHDTVECVSEEEFVKGSTLRSSALLYCEPNNSNDINNVNTESIARLPVTLSPKHFIGPVTSCATDPIRPVDASTLEPYSTSRFALGRSPTSARPRRRSSQQRVSLIAGRLSMISLEAPSPQPPLSPRISRLNSQSSSISAAVSTAPPSPSEKTCFIQGRSISEFVIEGDVGRGAYGLVKRAREMNNDGSLGPPVIIKQVIKSRILADCWKKHPKYGTIPIEIYVMSALSSMKYVLPSRRPWDPRRFRPSLQPNTYEGQIVMGHPNICRLVDFFEDSHYYYLVMPSTLPSTLPTTMQNTMRPPSDLFDLVESHPQGLPTDLVRSYLGQLADALYFLHSKGIVHRDVKDENVILGLDPGICILIDFGSSALIRKNGWDTFSGTLDYAGPEILRGERYYGKEQDVWAFGVVAFVLLIGECPFNTAAEAQEGLESPFNNASIALDERCGEGKEEEGRELDGGGALGDAAVLVRACLNVIVSERPTFEKIISSIFLAGNEGINLGAVSEQVSLD